MRSEEDPQQQSDDLPEFETNDEPPPLDLPAITEPPKDAVVIPPPEWIDPSAPTFN